MSDVGLKIVVGADLSAVNDGMKVAANNIAQFGDRAAKAFDEVAASAGALERLNDFIDKLGDEALGAGQKVETAFEQPLKSIAHLEAEIESLENELSTATDFATLKRLNEEIVKTKVQLNNLKVVGFESTLAKINPAAVSAANGLDKVKNASKAGANALTDINRVIQDSAFGFVGIQNNITELPGKFRALSAAAKESGQSISKVLLSTLMGPAGIGTAISVITSALTFASVGFSAWTRGFTNSSKATKDASASLEDFNKLIQGVSGEVGKSASRVTTLVNALESGTLNASQRKKALDELKQQNQEFFGALKDEKGLIEGLEGAYNSYLSKLKEIGTAKAIEAQFTKLFDRKLELELRIDPKFNAAASKDIQKIIGALTKQLDKLGGPVDIKENNDITKLNDNLRERLRLQSRIAQQRSANIVDLGGVRQEIEQIELQIKGLVELQKVTGNFNIGGAGGKDKKEIDALKNRLEVLEGIKRATEETAKLIFLHGIDDDIEATTRSLVDLETQISELKIQIAIRDADKKGIPKAELDKQVIAIKDETQASINKLLENQRLLFLYRATLKVDKAKIETKDITSEVAKATGFDKKIAIRTQFQIDEFLFGTDFAKFRESLRKLQEDLKQQVKDIFTGGLSDVFSGIGDSFGEALVATDFGEGLKKAAQNILGIVGSTMQQLGKALITAAIKIKLLKETFEKWAIANPALAIVAGIGLVAAGAALKNIKFDGPKFAEGGIVSGPTIGQIGERFRPEVVLPLDRLPQLFKQLGGDVGGGMQLIPIINNEGLYLAMKRGERSAGRKF